MGNLLILREEILNPIKKGENHSILSKFDGIVWKFRRYNMLAVIVKDDTTEIEQTENLIVKNEKNTHYKWTPKQ
jgi:hypothetical protein